MLWTPQKGRVKLITNGGIVGSATPGTGVPSSGTTLLDGAVTELISAAANVQDSWGIYINVTASGASTAAAEATMDILVGGATDDVLIESLIVGYATASSYGRGYYFPVHIPAGLRVAATLASVRTGITSQVLVTLYGGGVPPHRVGRKVTTYGSKINNARGQAVSPTASGGAASVTQMTAATAADHFAFVPGFQAATDTTITPAGHVNIGIGVGADTADRIGTWYFTKDTVEAITGPIPPMPAYCDVLAGSRLVMLASNSGANDAAYDGLIYAVS